MNNPVGMACREERMRISINEPSSASWAHGRLTEVPNSRSTTIIEELSECSFQEVSSNSLTHSQCLVL